MLQDMFDSELYMSSYRSVGEEAARSTRYRDVEYLRSEAPLDESSIVLASRQSFFICPTPGASDWFKISF